MTMVQQPTRAPPRALPTIREDWRQTQGTASGTPRQRPAARKSLSLSGASIIAQRQIHRNQPWTAPSVQALTSRMGNNTTARPLLVEGPAGPVISAVGTASDNQAASSALLVAQTRRSRAGISMPTTRAGANVVDRGGGRSFGAVYEYKDCFGVPKVVGKTSTNPEQALLRDTKNHQGVKNMMTYQGGEQDVVWAGVGTYPLGKQEMESITAKIVNQRSKKYQLAKLSGPKPYSAHGF